MQEKVEIITNHFEQYWTKIPQNGYCELEVTTNLFGQGLKGSSP